MRFVPAAHALWLAISLVPTACDSPGGGGSSPGGPTGTSPDASNPGTSNPPTSQPDTTSTDTTSTATGPSCGTSADCDYWYCECSNGSVVNSRTCDNGHCQSADDTCPVACADLGATFVGVIDPSNVGPTDPTDTCGGFTFSNNASCGSCYHDACCDEGTACADDADCLQYWDCAVLCRDGACLDGCTDLYPWGAAPYQDFQFCLLDNCKSACGF